MFINNSKVIILLYLNTYRGVWSLNYLKIIKYFEKCLRYVLFYYEQFDFMLYILLQQDGSSHNLKFEQ